MDVDFTAGIFLILIGLAMMIFGVAHAAVG
jgi:hypothetical protein